MELWSTTTQQIVVEWFHHRCQPFGIRFRWIFNVVEFIRTKTGISLRIGREKNGFQSHVADQDTQFLQSFMRVQAMRWRTIAESKLLWYHISEDDKMIYDFYRKQRPDLWWNQGCLKALQLLLIRKLHVVGIVAIVIAFLQVSSNSFLINETWSIKRPFFPAIWFNHQHAFVLHHQTQTKIRHLQIILPNGRLFGTKAIVSWRLIDLWVSSYWLDQESTFLCPKIFFSSSSLIKRNFVPMMMNIN